MDAREVTTFPSVRSSFKCCGRKLRSPRARWVAYFMLPFWTNRSVCVIRASEAVDADITEDLCCALYNSVFNQVVVVLSLGSVRVYQAEVSAVLRCRSAR
jgi:hypothetical protein